MRAIEDWLNSLGLGDYGPRFAENDIDFSILPELTDQDLEKIGVTSLGHRRKILRAIAALDGSGAATEPAPAAPHKQAPASRSPPAIGGAEAAGERRYLTVMFCDLVGSTEISAQLDAEEWRNLVGAYLDAASAAVAEMGGHVAKKLGDGLMALFGYPLAHENDAERAARAALSIQRALGELNRKNESAGKPILTARIGLETGPAVVDAAGEIYGDVANVAARVQALAEPGTILITARVQRQVAGLFVAEDRGIHALKGVPEPTTLFKLVRASGGGRRAGQRQLTPLVGRDDEMAMLIRRWERARSGDGQLVLIVGEPGLGKSRLIEEFRARLSDTPHTWVEWSCSQLLQNTPLHPIAEWGRARFGGVDVPAERRLADLESSLAQVKLDPTEYEPLLAPLLDMPLPAERAPKLAGEELRRRQLAALTNWVIAGAKVQPVVLALEDLHWADPTTIDVLRGIAEQGAQAPLFILATTRPEFRPPWSMRSHHGTISLAPLDRAQVRDMVGELAARHALPQSVVEDVAARTGGVPLFVEEVTRLLLERGNEGGIQAIPPTLQQLLMARLDRLGAARELAQIGAVIGRGFSYKLLQAVGGTDDAAMTAALAKLADADIVLVQGQPPDSDYRFKHALIQDAAYENLLKSRRQVLHRRVAEILRDRFAHTAAAEPEVLAHHFTQAAMTDAAIEWWGKAGDQALRRSAFQEAIAHLGKAIEMADKESEAAPRGAAAPSERLKLQTNYGQAVMWSKGYAAPETAAAFARAQELAEGTDASERFVTYYGQWGVKLLSAELNAAREMAEIMLRQAGPEAQTSEALAAHRMVALVSLCQGNFTEARTHSERALIVDDSGWDRDAKLRFGQDSRIAALCYLGLSRWALGDVGSARKEIEKASTGAAETGHVPTQANTYYFAAMFDLFRGDAEAVLDVAKPTVELSREHGLSLYLAVGGACHGWACARLRDRENGGAELRQAIKDLANQGNKLWLPLYQGLLAQIESDGEDSERASATIDEAVALANQIGGHWATALLHRIRGEILWKRDPTNSAAAEEAFLTAIAIAQQQKAKSFELQAAHALAKLYRSASRPADAHAVLAPALEGFSPTPEFPEIEEAQTLLAALAETSEVKRAAAVRQRQAKLQVSYANALIAARGYGAAETAVAFARARELTMGKDDAIERFSALYGLWAGHLVRGELAPMRETAETILRSAEMRPTSPEAGIAHRLYALTCWYRGDYTDARRHLERALAILDLERDRDLTFRFGQDQFVAAEIFLALVLWSLGEVAEAERLADAARRHATESGQIATQAYTHVWLGVLETVRRNVTRAKQHADRLIVLCRERDLVGFSTWGGLTSAWTRAWLSDGEAEATIEFQQALSAHIAQPNKLCVPLYQALLAEIESGSHDPEAALSRIDEALALASETGEHWSDALLHRIRGEILLKHDPANTALAEEAFLTAIAVSQQQKARSFELRAALALAKLYQSTGRAADAYAVLARALEGFSPTPEFPEIAEAQALLSALAESDEVRTAAAFRRRRLHLQTAYANALIHARGHGALETSAAFDKARALATGDDDDAAERFSAYYGRWAGSVNRGEPATMQETAAAFLRETAHRPRSPEAGVAQRIAGLTSLYLGNYSEARARIEKALDILDSERDRELAFRFGQDQLAAAMIYLALALWPLGEVERARQFADRAVKQAAKSGNLQMLVYVDYHLCFFEAVRGDRQRALPVAQAVHDLAREHAMPIWEALGGFLHGWANWVLGDQQIELAKMRQGIERLHELGQGFYRPYLGGLLAEAQADDGKLDIALAELADVLTEASTMDQHFSDAELHRIRGEILWKRDPKNTAPAEEAFLTAIAISQQQKARSFELRAAISLAKLYQSTGRAADAHAVLAPALAGFSPTPEFPEIEEAQTLLATLLPITSSS